MRGFGLFLLLPNLVVADAEESEIDEWIVKISPSSAQFIGADIPVLVKVPISLNQVLVVYFEQIKTVQAGAEHLVQISDFLFVGLEASRIEPVYHEPPPSAGPFAVHRGWTAIEELRIFRTIPRLPRLRSHRNGREHDCSNQRTHAT